MWTEAAKQNMRAAKPEGGYCISILGTKLYCYPEELPFSSQYDMATA